MLSLKAKRERHLLGDREETSQGRGGWSGRRWRDQVTRAEISDMLKFTSFLTVQILQLQNKTSLLNSYYSNFRATAGGGDAPKSSCCNK